MHILVGHICNSNTDHCIGHVDEVPSQKIEVFISLKCSIGPAFTCKCYDDISY